MFQDNKQTPLHLIQHTENVGQINFIPVLEVPGESKKLFRPHFDCIIVNQNQTFDVINAYLMRRGAYNPSEIFLMDNSWGALSSTSLNTSVGKLCGGDL